MLGSESTFPSPLYGLRTIRFRRGWLFRFHRAGEELRLTSEYQLSKYLGTLLAVLQ